MNKNNKKKMLTFQINEIEFERLKGLASTRNMNNSAFLRMLVNDRYEMEQMAHNIHYRLQQLN